MATLDKVIGKIGIFVTTTGNSKIITMKSRERLRSNAMVRGIGRFDNEIELLELEGFPGIRVVNIKLRVDRVIFPNDHGITMLAVGRLCRLSARLTSLFLHPATSRSSLWNP